MKYDFDKIIDRTGTNCLKYDFAKERGKPEGILPFWVADMDFQTAPGITKRLEKIVQTGIFGYTETKSDYFQAIAGWYEKHFQWEIEEEWLVKTPGVVFALAAAVRAFTEECEGVMIQQPVYYPFSEVIRDNHRKIVNNSLQLVNGHYEMDFEDMEKKFKSDNVKLLILCSPHNPVGRVWEKWELQKLGELCLRYQVTVVSDEIHADFVYPGNKHTVFTAVDERLKDISVICTAPSKTFNLAGLQVSNVFIPNYELRKKFQKAIAQAGYSQLNMLGLYACQTAYEEGGEWLEQLKLYLSENLEYVKNYLKEYLPQIHLIEPEGTYLLWLDFRELGLSENELEHLIVDEAGLWLDRGAIFGKDGRGFERINIACPRVLLEKAMGRLKDAVNKCKKVV